MWPMHPIRSYVCIIGYCISAILISLFFYKCVQYKHYLLNDKCRLPGLVCLSVSDLLFYLYIQKMTQLSKVVNAINGEKALKKETKTSRRKAVSLNISWKSGLEWRKKLGLENCSHLPTAESESRKAEENWRLSRLVKLAAKYGEGVAAKADKRSLRRKLARRGAAEKKTRRRLSAAAANQ